jgi:uncharacterized protein (DUF1800 family)
MNMTPCLKTSHQHPCASARDSRRLQPLGLFLGSLPAMVLALAAALLPWRAEAQTLKATELTVRAKATLAGTTGATMQLLVNSTRYGQIEVRNADFKDYVFTVPELKTGDKVDVVFVNKYTSKTEDRNLYLELIRDKLGLQMLPTSAGVTYDRGEAALAFDGLDVVPGQGAMVWAGALRFVWAGATPPAPAPPAPPAPGAPPAGDTASWAASRFLQQATFGPTLQDIATVRAGGMAAWLDAQNALPWQPVFLNGIQAWYDQNPANILGGSNYSPNVASEHFWRVAATAPDQLRQRVGFALQQIFVVSLQDGNLYSYARAYGHYMDRLAFHSSGNFRQLLEEVALHPVMGLYLSHLRNRAEDPRTGRVPDENFAREVMQLMTIGLHELNLNGTPRLGGGGLPIEAYTTADVLALGRVFTGWSWAYDNPTDATFWANPSSFTTGAARVDIRPMHNYANFHAPQEKLLFSGKPHALRIPAGTSGPESVRLALDTLFKHPNVGPFIGKQLIQRLVTSNPSPAYVARVATVFNNNGKGTRGDMAAVVRAVLLDAEARPANPDAHHGKLREPVVRVAHALRSLGGASSSGQFKLSGELADVGQRAQNSPSVFNFYRPGYVPPNTELATAGQVAPELQIVGNNTVVAWVNLVQRLLTTGLGRNGTAADVTLPLSAETALAASSPAALVDHLNTVLLAGRMSDGLRQNILQAMAGVPDASATGYSDRARLAVLLALSSPDYLIQR